MKNLKYFGSVSTVLVLVLAATLIDFVTSCAREAEGVGKIGVTVTILPIADFVENVGGEKVDVTVMVPPGASPHTYEPTPSKMVKVSKAKMYAKVGSGIEFELVWMDKLVEQNKKMLVVDCSAGIMKIGKDPHIWNSPVNAKKMVENICAGLIEIDPKNKDYYTENKNRYLRDLDGLDAYIRKRLGGLTNRSFMIYHPAFGYFANEYNLTQLAIEHKGKEPTPKVIQDCIDLAKRHKLSYIFVAPQFATQHAETIASSIGGRTVFIDPLPRLYIPNMRSVAASLSLEME
jgi:zinc transport system substrate-binding protein